MLNANDQYLFKKYGLTQEGASLYLFLNSLDNAWMDVGIRNPQRMRNMLPRSFSAEFLSRLSGPTLYSFTGVSIEEAFDSWGNLTTNDAGEPTLNEPPRALAILEALLKKYPWRDPETGRLMQYRKSWRTVDRAERLLAPVNPRCRSVLKIAGMQKRVFSPGSKRVWRACVKGQRAVSAITLSRALDVLLAEDVIGLDLDAVLRVDLSLTDAVARSFRRQWRRSGAKIAIWDFVREVAQGLTFDPLLLSVEPRYRDRSEERLSVLKLNVLRLLPKSAGGVSRKFAAIYFNIDRIEGGIEFINRLILKK